jgi:hypothetical protein
MHVVEGPMIFHFFSNEIDRKLRIAALLGAFDLVDQF